MTDKLRSAAAQALEALEQGPAGHMKWAIDALRAALAEPDNGLHATIPFSSQLYNAPQRQPLSVDEHIQALRLDGYNALADVVAAAHGI